MILKKAILRGFLGIPIGVFISTTISIIYSLVYGKLMVVTPVDGAMSSLNLYLIQYIVSIIIGFVFASSSVIFEVEKLNLAKQTVIHFIITLVVFLPCSIVARWLEFNFAAILVYILIFIVIYMAIWFIQYFSWKRKINKLNKKLNER
ncbi:hypothetical protein CLTEP_25560 [Clostridium tepidiprofundi DSM 19306]|uniref:DUF3021 domain-containing protein n=1 Tax=Clostridium tepidiprofundi DSM 19306 TaxID=1121338 RepID=A0A151ASP6_9CLOT|nr:DUF3021 domain-containing protein [Clostridium tepidiprofundi]KYH30612.1 hypothetical protein CLTEP_25560 [Clostridium tepidiprofundi DSM 19306]